MTDANTFNGATSPSGTSKVVTPQLLSERDLNDDPGVSASELWNAFCPAEEKTPWAVLLFKQLKRAEAEIRDLSNLVTSLSESVVEQEPEIESSLKLDYNVTEATAATPAMLDLLEEVVQKDQAAEIEGFLVPLDLQNSTKELIAGFATTLAYKLRAAEKKYGYTDEWMKGDWIDECHQALEHHMHKGDPRDVAIYCAFLWFHKQSVKRD